ncbi:hypothetical protein [Geomonas subterranea]|uniref:hypothetical protein n=1 Tax=Geomonas subterranea TaxID=2847989 RepID=UPI001CD4D999|nr:hypothetical protein [Geomonas fuzhouensis]
MTTIEMTEQDKSGFQRGISYCQKWGEAHQIEVGVAEMALGAGLVAWGLHTGQLHLGRDVVGSRWADIGGAVSAGFGAVAGPSFAYHFLQSIFIGGVSGVAGVTLVTAIPAMALAGGAAAIFGAFGYTITDLAERSFEPDFAEILLGGSITAIGVALLVDGARRVIKDERVAELLTKIKDGVIELAPAASRVVLQTWDEIWEDIKTQPETRLVLCGTTVAGSLIGASVAAGSVSVLGSHAIGAVALSMGLISAPVWPVLAGGAVGLALGYPLLKYGKAAYSRYKC